MNATEKMMNKLGWGQHLSMNEWVLKTIFGASESFYCFDTYQFKDYSAVVADRFDPEEKSKRRQEVFPLDCEKAFQMGARLVQG